MRLLQGHIMDVMYDGDDRGNEDKEDDDGRKMVVMMIMMMFEN
jgi:hypothetical protein